MRDEKTATGTMEDALRRCRDQFAFYAREHEAAGKHDKAATNRQFAQIAEDALSATRPPAQAGAASLAREPATADTMRWRCEGPRSTEDANNRNLFWVGPGRPVAWVTREAGDAIVAALSRAAPSSGHAIAEGGGQDRKFAFRDGLYVNRVSGEAIPADEPVIIFRARDWHALQVLRYYHSLVVDDHHEQAVQERIGEFQTFKDKHPERMKEPGVTRHIRLNAATTPPTTNDAIPAGEADEAHRLACVLRIAQASSNEHGEDMIRAAGMLDRLIYLPVFTRRPPEQAVPVPAGWKLVPEMNTPKMCEAYEDLYCIYGDGPPVETVWSAMLSAAPSAPATEAGS